MRAALVIAALELRRRLRDRSVVVQGVVAPVALAAIIGFAFGGQFSFDATIGVADRDASELSTDIVAVLVTLDDDDVPVRFVAVDPDEASSSVDDESLAAAIVVPEGFAEAILSGATPPALEVVVDAARPVAGDVATSAARRIGGEVDLVRTALAAVVAVGGDTEAVAAVLESETALAVQVVAEPTDDGYDPVAYFAPSMAMLFLFFTVGAGARSLLTEQRDGTLARVRAAPVRTHDVLAGKAGAVLVLGFGSLVVVWAVTSVVFGADWGDPVAVVAVIAAVVVAISGISVVVIALARTDVQAEGITSMVAFGFALLGGSFIQPGGMPPTLERIAGFTPNGLALGAFTEIGAVGAGLTDVMPAILVLLAMGVAAGLFGAWVIGRRGLT